MTPPGKIIRLLLLLLVLAGVLPFIFPWQKPLLSWRSLSLPAMPDVSAALDKLPDISVPLPEADKSPAEKPVSVTVYRWRDEQGSWHFSNEAPKTGVKYEQMSIDPNTNLLPAAKPVAPADSTGAKQETTQAEDASGYTAEEFSQLKEKAEAARQAMEQHYKEQEKRLQELR